MTNDTKTRADGFTEAERTAIKERAKELKAQGRSGEKKADNERAALDAIAAMPDEDRLVAERVHALVTDKSNLLAKTWYGMPAYANADGKVVCFFQSADKFKARYATFGFNDAARLDDGPMWPTSFAIVDWNDTVAKRVGSLVEAAVA